MLHRSLGFAYKHALRDTTPTPIAAQIKSEELVITIDAAHRISLKGINDIGNAVVQLGMSNCSYAGVHVSKRQHDAKTGWSLTIATIEAHDKEKLRDEIENIVDKKISVYQHCAATAPRAVRG